MLFHEQLTLIVEPSAGTDIHQTLQLLCAHWQSSPNGLMHFNEFQELSWIIGELVLMKRSTPHDDY